MSETPDRYYLDTEFIDDGSTIDLISIGIVCEDGREWYAEVEPAEVDWAKASDWVRANVFPHLQYTSEVIRTKAQIAGELQKFVNAGSSPPEFWSWCSAYDWIALCQLYGTMMDKPSSWPNYCRDLQQELDRLGISDDELEAEVVSAHDGPLHNALADAWWHHDIHQWLRDTEATR